MNRQTQPNSLLLSGAALVLPEKTLEPGSVLVQAQTIKRIYDGEATEIHEQCEVIDLTGFCLFPGFIDVHIHGAAGVDVMSASSEDLIAMSLFLASMGVTGWVPTLVPAPDENYRRAVNEIAAAMENNSCIGGRVLGLHYEGPFVNTAQCGALHRDCFKTYSVPSDLNNLFLPDRGAKMITLAPEIAGGIALVKELNERGWVVSIGHTRADVNLLDDAFANGARHMTHFMNAMLPLHHRNPGPIAWGLSRDDVTCDMIADGVHLDPSILRLLLKIKGAGRLSLISDAIAATGKGDGSYQIWGETITVTNGRTSNASGSIAGSVITMLDAVRMMRSLGVPDVEIAWMASSNPARLLKIDHECGSIEEGKRADLVAIDARGQVKLTMVGGEVVFSA
jgi:N-acetylglucosamine-6-phosphate deacetylase